MTWDRQRAGGVGSLCIRSRLRLLVMLGIAACICGEISCKNAGDPQIAFVSRRDGDTEIYIMNSDSSGQMPLTDNKEWDGELAWSPDGKRDNGLVDSGQKGSQF
jgi:WD40-like Beta Propeller Repeat